MNFDVLISHSTADKSVSNQVCDRLEMAGIRCWIAPRNIAAGAEWTAAILEGIEASRLMVLVFSESANASRHVQREILYATEKKMAILPVRIQHTTPSGSLAYCLLGVQWLDALTPPVEQHFGTLISRVRGILNELEESAAPRTDEAEHDADLPLAAPVPKPRDIFFECSECGRSMIIDAGAAGMAVDCIFCEKEVVVPGRPAQRESVIEPAILAQITEQLGHAVGPIARHLVKAAASGSPTLYDLCHDLAGQIPDKKERARFLAAVGNHAKIVPGSSGEKSTQHEVPGKAELSGVVWPPEVLKAIKSQLAVYIGPVAGVLVERTAKEAASPRDLHEKLAAHLHSPKEREQWLRSAPPGK